MRVAIETLGTRGDVQPYLALAKALQERGHDVQLTAPDQFAEMAREYAVPFAGLPGEFLQLLYSPEGKAAIAGDAGFAGGLKLLKHVRPLMMKLLQEEWRAVRGFRPDVIVYHPKSFGSPDMAEALRLPHILASPLPGFTPTSEFPSPMLPFHSLGPFNRISHFLAIGGAAVLFGRDLRRWRETTLDLPRRRGTVRAVGTLYAYSPAIVPVPGDWGPDVRVTGYWFLDHPEWRADDKLESFLQAGPAPIYFGFGSMPGTDPRSLTLMISEALQKSGRRGLLVGGGGALAPTDNAADLHFLESAPHDRLLPRMAAAVHHGGAGTTGATLRAGLPTQIIPFMGDQPFWGRRIAALGAGPFPLDRRNLSSDQLVESIDAMNEDDMRRRAQEIALAIARDEGVGAAVQLIEERATSSKWSVR